MSMGCPECGSLTGEHLPQCTWRDRHPVVATISLDGCTVNPEWAARAMSDALRVCSNGKVSFDDELAKKVFGAVAETFNMVLRNALRLHAHVTTPRVYTGSFPFLQIAQTYGVDYGEVLRFAECYDEPSRRDRPFFEFGPDLI